MATTMNGMLLECAHLADPERCALDRESLVAGTNAPIPDCPLHGEWADEDLDLRGCGVDEAR